MSEPLQSTDVATTSADDAEDPTGRLRQYMLKTQSGLDLLALLTLWIVVVPPGDLTTTHAGYLAAILARVTLSVIYGIDITIRVLAWPNITGAISARIRSGSSPSCCRPSGSSSACGWWARCSGAGTWAAS